MHVAAEDCAWGNVSRFRIASAARVSADSERASDGDDERTGA